MVACLEQLSEPLITSKLASELLVSLHSLSSDDVKQYVVKCRLEQLPEQNQSEWNMQAAQAGIPGGSSCQASSQVEGVASDPMLYMQAAMQNDTCCRVA